MVPVVLGLYAVVFVVSGAAPVGVAVGSMGLVLVLAAVLAGGVRLVRGGWERVRLMWHVGVRHG